MVAAGLHCKIKLTDMKNRIFTGWSFRRVLYLAMGIAIMIQGIHDKEWVWLLPGLYFAAMGLFAFGCASGNCFGGDCTVTQTEKNKQ